MSPEHGTIWFGEWLREAGFRPQTVQTRVAYAKRFTAWLVQSSIEDFREVDSPLMIRYAGFLQNVISKRTGKPYKQSTKANQWCIAVSLMTALYDAAIVSELIAPHGLIKVPNNPLPTMLSESDIALILEHIDTSTALGRRDRALFELIYSAGLRVSEAVKLQWTDLNLNDRLAHIRQAKFDKDRVVPLTHEAVEMFRRYQAGLLPRTALVFPGHSNRPVTTSCVNRRFKDHAKAMGVYRVGINVHQLRHACATHMIAHGADIRYVQELLGHESVQTTVRYTHDQVEQVRRMYRSYHPRENQLYQEVDHEYLQRIADLKAHIIAGRQKHIAKLQRTTGYVGGPSLFCANTPGAPVAPGDIL